MAKKLSSASVGLAFGLFLAVIHILRTIAIWLYPNFVINIIKKLSYNAVYVQPPIISVEAFSIGLMFLLVFGFVCGTIFAWTYNWFAR